MLFWAFNDAWLIFLKQFGKLGSQEENMAGKYIYISLPRLSCNIPQTPKVLLTVGAWWLPPVMECLREDDSGELTFIVSYLGWFQLIKEPVLLAAIPCHMRGNGPELPGVVKKNHPEYDYTSIQHVRVMFLSWSTATDWLGGSLRIPEFVFSEMNTPIRSGAPRTSGSFHGTLSVLELLILPAYLRNIFLGCWLLDRVQKKQEPC